MSSSRRPATKGLPAPPYDKSTRTSAIALFVFPLSYTEEMNTD